MGVMDFGSVSLTKKKPSVLIVDYDLVTRRTIADYFNHHDMRAVLAGDNQTMLRVVSCREPDLVVIGSHVGTDALHLLRGLRSLSVVPVILLAGQRYEETDRIVALELGADDVVTRPFGLPELLARVRANVRRRAMDMLHPMRREGQCYRFAGWQFDQRTRQLTNPVGHSVTLTKGEFALLSAFVVAPRRPLTREHLLKATRIHEDVDDRSINVRILRLRRKLGDDGRHPPLIRTERAIGYVLDADVQIA